MTEHLSPMIDRRALLALGASATLPARADEDRPPPNRVDATPQWTTGGQPGRGWLRRLKAQGFEAVVHLVPFDVEGMLPDEPEIVRSQGLDFEHLPIPFSAPQDAHVAAFAAILARLAGRRVLVHCEVNLRASTMVFLQRAIVRRDDPATAWDAVTRVWTPRGAWRSLVQRQLGAAGIAFDPF